MKLKTVAHDIGTKMRKEVVKKLKHNDKTNCPKMSATITKDKKEKNELTSLKEERKNGSANRREDPVWNYYLGPDPGY